MLDSDMLSIVRIFGQITSGEDIAESRDLKVFVNKNRPILFQRKAPLQIRSVGSHPHPKYNNVAVYVLVVFKYGSCASSFFISLIEPKKCVLLALRFQANNWEEKTNL